MSRFSEIPSSEKSTRSSGAVGSERHLTRRETGASRAGSVFLGCGRLRARPLAHSRSHRRALDFSHWDATSQEEAEEEEVLLAHFERRKTKEMKIM